MLAVLTIVLSISTLWAQSQEVYLTSHEDERSLIIFREGSFNITSPDSATVGLCLPHAGECQTSFNMKDAYAYNIARSMGSFILPKQIMDSLESMDNMILNTKVTKLSENERTITVNTVQSVKLQKMGEQKLEIEKLPLKIDLQMSGESLVQRKDYSEVSEDLKELHPSVFQIMLETNDGLAKGQGHGTGFFISKDGYALSNLHVIDGAPDCVTNKKCQLTILFKNQKIKKVVTDATVLTCSKLNDFCLFKLDLGKNNPHFKLDINNIERDLFTLGFPGDKSAEFEKEKNKEDEDEEEDNTALTYAFGSATGFRGLGIASTLYIFGGASGSPVLNQSNSKVVGVLSNGSGVDSSNAMAGIFRPLSMIERDFKITGFLTGESQKKIKEMIRSISFSDSSEEVKETLNQYNSLRTFYGEDRLKVLSYKHPSLKVRRAISKFLSSDRSINW